MRAVSPMKRVLAHLAAVAVLAGGMAFVQGCARTPDVVPGEQSLLRHERHEKPITVWFDATANWERLSTREGVARIMDHCVQAGVDVVIVDVKPISGHVLYDSAIAPRLTEWRGVEREDPDFDLLAVAIEEGHARDLKVFVAVNVFSEGHIGSEEAGVPRGGTFFKYPERQAWASVDYVVPEGETEPAFVPSTEGVRGHAMFTSAAHPEAVAYALNIVREVMAYPVDGICLDRARWSGGTADFSDAARDAFEAFLGHEVENWPEDIYRWERVDDGEEDEFIPDEGERAARIAAQFEQVEGPLYDRWLVWRAGVIQDFILRARGVVYDANPNAIFANYTGGWYPSYYQEGLNWASPDYDPSEDYDWAPADYQDTAFAHLLDHLYHGWYYTHVTEEDAVAAGAPWWASMEGSGRLMERIIGDAVPVHGGLFLFQYQGNPELFRACMRAAYDNSDGLMLFDLIYLEDYDWWDEIPRTFPERMLSP